MPLSGKLSDVPITLECPHCGHRLTKNGRWLRSVQHFNCGACLRRVRIGYSDKIRLFAKHAHLAKQPVAMPRDRADPALAPSFDGVEPAVTDHHATTMGAKTPSESVEGNSGPAATT
jgi:hypothetical protein